MYFDEINACQLILKIINHRPESKFFWDPPGDIINSNVTHPLNLRIISERLDINDMRYKSAKDFVEDMRLVFANALASNEKASIRYAAAQQLLNDFEELILQMNPAARTPMIKFQTHLTEFEITQIYPEHTDTSASGEKPGSIFFDQESESTDIQTLMRDIKFFTSSDMVFQLAAFVTRLQPEATDLSDGFSLNLGIMTDETKKEVRKFVTKLLHAAAVGEIDPFARPFGSSSDPMRVRERGDIGEFQ